MGVDSENWIVVATKSMIATVPLPDPHVSVKVPEKPNSAGALVTVRLVPPFTRVAELAATVVAPVGITALS